MNNMYINSHILSSFSRTPNNIIIFLRKIRSQFIDFSVNTEHVFFSYIHFCFLFQIHRFFRYFGTSPPKYLPNARSQCTDFSVISEQAPTVTEALPNTIFHHIFSKNLMFFTTERKKAMPEDTAFHFYLFTFR